MGHRVRKCSVSSFRFPRLQVGASALPCAYLCALSWDDFNLSLVCRMFPFFHPMARKGSGGFGALVLSRCFLNWSLVGIVRKRAGISFHCFVVLGMNDIR